MPKSMHDDDAQWIFSKVSSLHEVERLKVCEAYSNAFNKAFDAEHLPHRKAGRARFAANNRLRVYIAKKFAVFRNKRK